MKNLTNAKKVLVIMIMLVLISITGRAFAADSGFNIIPIDGSTSTNSSVNSTGNTLVSGSNSLGVGNSTGTTGTGNSILGGGNTSSTDNTANITAGTGNSSNYNTTNTASNLPETGLEDSLPMIALVVVLGISAVYAFRKIRDYQNL